MVSADGSAERHLLHSWKLSFMHPVTGEPMEFTQPLPEDMKRYMRADREQKEGEKEHEISNDS